MDKDYSASHQGRGTDYEARFTTNAGRALMWSLEQQVISSFVTRTRSKRVLDFATGTGRIAHHIAASNPSLKVTGIDISSSMLAVASGKKSGAQFAEMDGVTAVDHFGRGSFDLITSFRFLPNAEHSLRQRSADQMCELLSTGGHVIFNNHRNIDSIIYRARRVLGRTERVGAGDADLEELFTKRGMVVVSKMSLGVWPHSETSTFLLPWTAVRWVETVNLRWADRHSLGYNNIWLLQKA